MQEQVLILENYDPAKPEFREVFRTGDHTALDSEGRNYVLISETCNSWSEMPRKTYWWASDYKPFTKRDERYRQRAGSDPRKPTAAETRNETYSSGRAGTVSLYPLEGTGTPPAGVSRALGPQAE